MDLTQDYLKSVLQYNQETGEFNWKKSIGRQKRGNAAGSVYREYKYIMVQSKKYLAHRLAWFYMTGVWPKEDIDHRNHKTLDNSYKNLREATRSQNQGNRVIQKNNTSGFKGVHWHIENKKWQATITIKTVTKSLGYFGCVKEAGAAYNQAAIKYFGEFAYLNEIRNRNANT